MALTALIAGIIMQITINNDISDFISGAFIGGGIIILIRGKIK